MSHEEIFQTTDLINEDKKKSFGFSSTLRSAFIATVIFETALPLLSSLIQTSISPLEFESSQLTTTTTFITDDTNSSTITPYVHSSKWDTFWSRKTKIKNHLKKKWNIESDVYIQNSDLVSKALEELGPTFVKFGQAAASRPDLIPPPLAASFSKLQDRMTPFDTDVAKEIIQSDLRNKMRNIDTKIINSYNENETDTYPKLSEKLISSLLESLTNEPVAAASVGQVYKGHIEGYGNVAVKVQRPGLKDLVQSDAELLRSVAKFIESIPNLSLLISNSKSKYDENNKENVDNQQEQPPSNRLIASELVKGVDEFTSRLFEELDYIKEANNAKRFANLYSSRGGTEVHSLPSGAGVIVPTIYSEFCTENVLVMEWIDGSKIVDDYDEFKKYNLEMDLNEIKNERSDLMQKENLALIELGIQCTISQLLETGVLHADPHGGNLLRVDITSHDKLDDEKKNNDTPLKGKRKMKRTKLKQKLYATNNEKTFPGLAYLDFGLLAEVPQQVRDGLVCAVAQLVFARDVDAVASLFGELMLLPEEVLSDPVEREALTAALLKTIDEVLLFPSISESDQNVKKSIPILQFPKLIDALARLVPRFQFQLPPYFLNNARALGTLEGMARSIDPDFNVLRVLYPYALNYLLRNPNDSPVVFRTLLSLITSSPSSMKVDHYSEQHKDIYNGVIDKEKLSKLLHDASVLTGISKRKLVWDIIKSRKGQKLTSTLLKRDVKIRTKNSLKNLFISSLETRNGLEKKRLSSFLEL